MEEAVSVRSDPVWRAVEDVHGPGVDRGSHVFERNAHDEICEAVTVKI